MRAAVSKSILIVDDEREITRLVRRVLQGLGYPNVEEVTDAPTAFKLLKERSYDLVICDWNMAPMSGLQLLRRIRADEDLAALPFVMISGAAFEDRIVSARDEKVDYFIAKPFSTETLRRSLTIALENGANRR